MRLVVVIPAYNEAELLPQLFDRLTKTPTPIDPVTDMHIERRVVLVDDGSNDGTADVVKTLAQRDDVLAVLHKKNSGKGAALRSGFRAALQDGADIVLVQDADLEYDPCDHDAVLAPILDGRADVVIGSRFTGQTHRVLYYWHSVANRFITMCSNALTNLNLTDIECCSKAFTREVVERLTLRENRFGIEPELVARVSRMALPTAGGGRRAVRVYEVAVSYAGRTYAEGKKITWRDGCSALRAIVEHNLIR
jgi:glycosyltransferase involved in cell wall biosynthesis